MNNKGFTLLEVLVAVVILAVVSVPLLRSFATAAQTNRKSKIEEKCTTAAENLAESFRDVPVEELVAKYDTGDAANTCTYEEYDDGSGETYTFHIEDQDLIGSNMPEGYYAEVVLDSSYYQNANGLNLSKLNSVSKTNSAIYTMDPSDASLPDTLASYKCNEDVIAYDYFYQRNLAACAAGSSYHLLGDTQQAAYDVLRKNLKREIRFVVTKTGEYTKPAEGGEPAPEGGEPAEGEKVNLVNVTMTIRYIMEGHDGYYFPKGDNELVEKKSVLFDNSATKDEFTGVYLFFYPRYAAGCQSGKELDKVVLENPADLEFNFYITALEGADNPEKKASYLASKGLSVDVIENNPDVNTQPAAVSLFTNLNSGAPYSKSDTRTSVGELQMDLKYKTNEYDVKKSDGPAADFLRASGLDGKILNKEETAKRIYKMKVYIYDGTVTTIGGVDTKNVAVEFDGTKLEF